MKKLLLITFIFFQYLMIGQEFDVRSTNWGMTLQDVKLSEKPMSPNVEKSDELRYENVDLYNNISSTIIYSFSNGKLNEVRYLVYGPKDGSRGTCKNFIPIKRKLYLTQFIFEALANKNMNNSIFGWSVVPSKDINPKLEEGGFNSDIINLLDSEVKRLNINEVKTFYSNNRSNASIRIIASKSDRFQSIFECNDNYYNTYMWLVFTPTYEVKESLRSRNF